MSNFYDEFDALSLEEKKRIWNSGFAMIETAEIERVRPKIPTMVEKRTEMRIARLRNNPRMADFFV